MHVIFVALVWLAGCVYAAGPGKNEPPRPEPPQVSAR